MQLQIKNYLKITRFWSLKTYPKYPIHTQFPIGLKVLGEDFYLTIDS